MMKKHRERREYYRKYREANKERLAEQKREHYATPRGRAINMVNGFRRNDKKAGRGECTLTADWIEENIFNSECIYCGEDDWRKLSCDRIDNSLPHTQENVVCACGSCNKKRGTMPFDEFVKRCKDGDTLLKRNLPNLSKAIVAINDAGEVIYEFPSIREAARNGFTRDAVSKACRGCYGCKKNSHKYKGLLWFYK